jgi:magnesium chelatase family protein
MVGAEQPESTRVVAQRVAEARAAQRERWAGMPWKCNGEVPGPVLRAGRWRLPPSATGVLDATIDRGSLTVRGYDRVLRAAWTAADLDGATTPRREHVGLALMMRELGGVAA